MRTIKTGRTLGLLIVWLAAAVGCTGHFWPQPEKTPVLRTQDFVVVTAEHGDTLQSLAQTYLKDGSRWKTIATYNRIHTAHPGQKLVIPLHPSTYGGLQVDGYQTVPVLLYTDVGQTASSSQTVAAKAFESQLQYLKTADYNTISLGEFFGFLELKDQLPSRAVLLTFDGADRWIYDTCFPLLKKYQHKAALFIPVDQIDEPGKLKWIELSEMAAYGLEIGVLGEPTNLSPDKDPDKHLADLEREIVAAKKAIEQHLKPEGHYYAYPSGPTSDMTVALLKKHGFRLGFTRQRGANPFFVNNFAVSRSLISKHANMQQFKKYVTTFHKADLK